MQITNETSSLSWWNVKSKWHYVTTVMFCSKHTPHDSCHGRIGHLNHRQINVITEANLGCPDKI